MKIGVLVGENGNWTFLKELYADWQAHYQTTVFQEKTYHTPLLYGRLNRWAHQRGIQTLLQNNDICFFEWASELLVPASRLPKKCKIIARLHSYELYAWAPQVNWDAVDKIIFVSTAMRAKFAELYPAQVGKLELQHIGKDLERFRPVFKPFSFELGMLADIHPCKRIYEVVMLVYELKKKGYHPRLHLAGGRLHGGNLDEYYVAMQRLVRQLHLEQDVIFHGHVTDAAAWLQTIDIFISNSYWEGLQTALIEAMACGCYCLSHAWDGVEDALPAEYTCLTDFELEQKLIECANLPADERCRRQAEMRRLAEQRFDFNESAANMRALFERLAAG